MLNNRGEPESTPFEEFQPSDTPKWKNKAWMAALRGCAEDDMDNSLKETKISKASQLKDEIATQVESARDTIKVTEAILTLLTHRLKSVKIHHAEALELILSVIDGHIHNARQNTHKLYQVLSMEDDDGKASENS